MNRSRRSAASLLFLAATLCAFHHAPLQQRAPVTIDLVRSNEEEKLLVIFRAKIGGVEGKFFLDSGSVGASTIDSAFWDKLGKKEKPAESVELPMEVGAFEVGKVKFAVRKLTEVEGVDGILGCTFFEKCKITIDYPAGKITLAEFGDENVVAEQGKSAVVPFDFLNDTSGKPMAGVFVTAAIESKGGEKTEVLYCIDTGCNSTLIDTETAEKLKMAKVNFIEDTGTNKRFDIVQAASLSIPGIRWRNVSMVKFDHDQLKLARKASGKHVAGLIGTWILKRYIVTFDYHNKRVLFVVPPTPSK